MPSPGDTCNRCRQGKPPAGESWCIECSAWEGLGRELAGHWDSAGTRVIASDLVVNCARQVRALRSFGAGVSRASSGAGDHRAPEPRASDRHLGAVAKRKAADTRPSLPRRGSAAHVSPKTEAHHEEEEDEDFEEEGEEEEESAEPVHRPLPGGHKRPPEPPHPPPGKRAHHSRDHREVGHSDRRGNHRDRDRRTHHSSQKEKKRAHKRAGRKHQRLHRLVNNPLLRIHRKPDTTFWKLSSQEAGRQHLEREIL